MIPLALLITFSSVQTFFRVNFQKLKINTKKTSKKINTKNFKNSKFKIFEINKINLTTSNLYFLFHLHLLNLYFFLVCGSIIPRASTFGGKDFDFPGFFLVEIFKVKRVQKFQKYFLVDIFENLKKFF